MPALSRHEAPLPAPLLDELCAFWEQTFRTPYDAFRRVLLGAESGFNRDVVWVMREQGELAGTCHLTTPEAEPRLGGLGEVATEVRFRRRGIAAELCSLAREEFLQRGGRALFLGTGNPEAARVYHSLGWRKVAGTKLMSLTGAGESTSGFLEAHFGKGGGTVIEPMTPAARVPMIPLLVYPHRQLMLDVNADMVSTKYAVQPSCMGLFPRYDDLTRMDVGAVFCAHAEDGRLVGLSTVRMDDAQCTVDGFVHQSFFASWSELLQAALDWGIGRGASVFAADVAADDEGKRLGFERLGFVTAARRPPFVIGDQPYDALRMTSG
jgi:GNAT superfamily N-acetyltransferase